MKKLILIGFFILFIVKISNSQPWLDLLPQNKSEYSLYDYSNAFEQYWKPYDVKIGWYFDTKGQKHKAYGWKQFKRWENYWKDRVDLETGNFPETNAAIEYQKIIEKYGAKSDFGDWTCLGANSSDGGYAGIGRLSTIAFHPTNTDIFWVGAPAGGLWSTYDGGQTWTVLTDNNEVLGVSAIVIPSDFETSNTIYIGTGDRDANDNFSIGVLKSTDAGMTWNPTGLTFVPSEQTQVNNMLIEPSNNDIIYAATTEGLYKTVNAGTDWSVIYEIDFVDIEFCPNNSNIIYASTKSGAVYKTTDAGENWNMMFTNAGNNRVELAVSANNPAVVYALGSGSDQGLYAIYKSVNFGESFNIVFDDFNLLGWDSNGSDNGGQAWYDLALAVDPNNADVVYCGGVNTWRSVDGGANWNIVNHWWGDGVEAVHADKHFLKFRNNESVLFECNDGGVYHTSNGLNWTDITNGITINQIYGLSTAQTVTNTTILGLQDNGTKMQNNEEWIDVIGGDGMRCQIDYTDEKIQYGSLYYGDIYRTTNMWNSSTGISNNIPGGADGDWVTPFVIDPMNNNIIYVGYSKLWRSYNMGNTFEAVYDFGTNLKNIAICPTNNNYIYVGTYSTIYRSDDKGETWTNITSGLPSETKTYITVKHNDPNTVWVTIGGFNEHSIYKTTNGGQTWTNISAGLPQIPTNCVIQNNLESTFDQIYVGTDFGVFLKNGDEDWIHYSNGLPNVVVTELDIYYDYSTPENSRLRASTYGRGLWESDLYLTGNYAPMVSSLTVSNITQNTVTISGEVVNNFGFDILESGVLISLQPGIRIGGEGVVEYITNPVVSSGVFNLDIDNLSTGTKYFYRAYAENENGISYGAEYEFNTLCDVVNTFAWTEDCETGGDFPICFSKQSLSGDISWKVATGNELGTPGNAHSGSFNFLLKGSSTVVGTSELLLPIFDLSGLNSASIKFWMTNYALFGYQDVLSVWYKNSYSSNWTKIAEYNTSITQWTEKEVVLPNLSDEYYIAFRGLINGGRGICIDDIMIDFYSNINTFENNGIVIYPNPIENEVNINLPENFKNADIEIVDICGRIIYQNQLTSQYNNLQLSELETGMYLFYITIDEVKTINKIIVK